MARAARPPMSSSLPQFASVPPAIPVEPRRYTYAEVVSEIQETNEPIELWDGELRMSPAPSFHHQEVVLNLARLLHAHVQGRALGKVVTAPIDMVLSPHCAVQPDVAFIAQERLHIVERVIMGPVDLAMEVVSLGSRHRDRIEKRDLYEQHGIKEYWIVDPEAKTIEVLFLKAGQYELVGRWTAGSFGNATAKSRMLEGFEVPADALFV